MGENTIHGTVRGALTDVERERCHHALVRANMEALAPFDLLAECDEIELSLQLLLADEAARDFSRIPEILLNNAIAYEAQRLREVIIQIERLTRARRLRNLTGVDAATAFAPRWEAVRALDLIEALQTLGVSFTQRGDEWWSCCPLHEEGTPSFSANRTKQVWHCFSCCKGGDLIDFISFREHCSKVEALRFAEVMLLGKVAA